MAYETATVSGVEALISSIKSFASANGWTAVRDDTDELILNNGSLYVGYQYYFDVGLDYYNMNIMSSTGYDSSQPFHGQPMGIYRSVSLNDSDLIYYMSVNDRRIMCSIYVHDGNYEFTYLGKNLPYCTPEQYPNNDMCIGTSELDSNRRYSTAGVAGFVGGDSQVRIIGGEIRGSFSRGKKFGQYDNDTAYFISNAVGTAISRLSVYASASAGSDDVQSCELIGTLDGVYDISGYAVNALDSFAVGSKNYLCWPSSRQSGFNDYIALELS
jgi:hypothetical protein